MTTYNHSSNSDKLDKREYNQKGYSLKPHGLWLTTGDQWVRQLNNMGWGVPDKCHTLTLVEDANILEITDKNASEILKKYYVDISKDKEYGGLCMGMISWKLIASKYDGIIFRIPNRGNVLKSWSKVDDNIEKMMFDMTIFNTMTMMDIELSLVVWNLDKCKYGDMIPVPIVEESDDIIL